MYNIVFIHNYKTANGTEFPFDDIQKKDLGTTFLYSYKHTRDY